MKDWDPEDVVLGYDGVLDGVAHCRGEEMLFYFEALGIWSPPLRIDIYDMLGDLDLQPRIVSCATLDSKATGLRTWMRSGLRSCVTVRARPRPRS